MKKLVRYKEKKELVKEKEKRAREKKGVFKVGLYRPQPLAPLPQAPAATTKAMVRGHSLTLSLYTADISIDIISFVLGSHRSIVELMMYLTHHQGVNLVCSKLIGI